MSKNLIVCATAIIDFINAQCEDLDSNERAMVVLFVSKLAETFVEHDIIKSCEVVTHNDD